MPLYMDRHDLSGASPADLAVAHQCDLELQAAYGVRFLTYWHHAESSVGFCLMDAPDAQTAQAVHAAAHGNIASQVIEVEWRSVEAFLGPVHEPPAGAPWEDIPRRAIVCARMARAWSRTASISGNALTAVVRPLAIRYVALRTAAW